MRPRSVVLIVFFFGISLSAQQFPRYIVKAGKTDPDGNPFDALSSASLCVLGPAGKCFTLPPEYSKGDADYFYMDPKSSKTTSASGEELVLFTAHTMGGSGCTYEYALLRKRNGTLTNLLPTVTVSNISDSALWNLPELSPMPIFLTADFLWEDGAHYGDHRYSIRGYRYDEATSKYIQIFSYDTRRRYPSADLTGNESVHVIDAERVRISQLLQQRRKPTR